MASALLRERLPPGCEIGVTSDGRVFFVNDHNQSTSWLHPATGEPILTGLQGSAGLPKGWEQDNTLEGQVFYVDHNRRLTTFVHPQDRPQHHFSSTPPPTTQQQQQEPAFVDSRAQPPQSPSSPGSPTSPNSTLTRDNFKRGTFKQRSVKAPTAKRNPNSEVVKRGWLYKYETGGLSKSKTWKKRWAVLADFALFLYKSEEELSVVSSILLPGYKLNPCTQEDNIRRNFVFKVEHENTKTVYLGTDDSPEFVLWMSLLRQASMMNGQSGFQREANNNYRHYPPKDVGNLSMDHRPHPDSNNDSNSLIHSVSGNGNNYSPSSNPSFQKLPNFRPYNEHEDVSATKHVPPPRESSLHLSQDGQSPSYHGYNDPASSPMDPHPPRVGGVYPFILQQGQRQSYVSMGSSNRDSYAANLHNNNSNDKTGGFSYSARDVSGGREDNSHQNPPPNHQRWQDNLEDRHGPGPEMSFDNRNGYKPLRDGFAPDSVRSSLAQVDQQRNSYASSHRDHMQQQQYNPNERASPNDYVDLSRPAGGYSQNDSLSRYPNQPHDNSQNNSFSRNPNQPYDTSQNNSFYKNQPHNNSFSRNQNPPPQHFNTPQDPDTSRPGSFYNPMTNPNNRSHEASFHRNNNPDWIHQQQQSQPVSSLPPGSDSNDVRSRLSQSSRDSRARYPPPQQDPQGHRSHPQYPDHDRRSFASSSSTGYYQQQQQQQQPPTQFRPDTRTSSQEGSNSSFQRDNRNKELAAAFPHHQRNDSHLSSSNHNQRAAPPSSHHSSSSFSPNTQHIPPHSQPNNQQLRYPYDGEQDYPPSSSSHSNLHPPPGDHYNPHTYVNFPSRQAALAPPHQQQHDTSRDSSLDQPPSRPLYPAEMRGQIVEEIAKVQTPVTQKDFLISATYNQQRMQQPSFFQYPSPRDGPDSKRETATLQSSSPRQQNVNIPRDEPNSRFSTSSRGSRASSRGDRGQGPGSQKEAGNGLQDSFSRNMMDPEAQKLRVAYERVHSLRLSPDKAPPRRKAAPIQTVKEDPDMPDKDVLETDLQKVAAKNPLNGPRLRMSISAADLIGKTHDELVLLLIQLRRNQAALDQTRDMYRHQIDKMRPAELEYRRQMQQFGVVPDEGLHNTHRNFSDAKSQMEEIENKLEVYRPIINLLDNMVTMGSLYGGDNLMLATQYRKHLLRPDQYQPAKKMLEFSRQQQEERLVHGTHEDIKQLSKDEVDLEDKIDRLNEVDRLLQEQSFKVSSFKEDKELMEKALIGILRQQDQNRNDPREIRKLTQQQRNLEKEISRVTQQLAEASKELEETTAENNKLEHEIALLRTKVHGELSRSRSAPSLASENIRTKMKMEKELAKVQDMMHGLNQKGAKLSQAMNTLRRSSSGTHLASAMEESNNLSQQTPGGSYLQTDLDSGEQIDLASAFLGGQNPGAGIATGGMEAGYPPTINHHRQNATDWDVDRNDEDTKKFFGLLPRDKPKGQTVRDVKRLSEARKEEKRREDDFGEEIKLRVSNVDNEVSSIIHARIAKDTQSVMHSAPGGDHTWESGQPLYENLPRYGSMPALADNNSSNNNNNNNNTNAPSASSSRRSSIILLTPKPFVPYQDKSARPFRSELALNLTKDMDDRYDNNPGDNSSNATDYNNTSGYFNKGKSCTSDRPYHSQDLLSSSDSHTYQPEDDGSYGGGSKESLSHSLNQSEGQFHARPTTIVPTKGMPKSIELSPIVAQSTNGRTESAPEQPVTQDYQSRVYAPRPWAKTNSADQGQDTTFNPSRKLDRGRYMTISSSQPIKMESNSIINPTIHSAAGDLILNRSIDDVPDIVKSSQGQGPSDQIDGDVIDREILSVPDKVLIPERYDAEADAEDLTEDEKQRRQERSERIRRILTSQSVMSLSQPDVSKLPGSNVHSRIQQERKERAHFLALNQELARQVTQQSKKQAAERRKTWSGAQFADAKKQYDQEMLNSSMAAPLRSPDPVRKRSELTLRNL